jgi:cytochrome oxidase Cu insertion factor (SCO1/SenC/PrrC family)
LWYDKCPTHVANLQYGHVFEYEETKYNKVHISEIIFDPEYDTEVEGTVNN